MSDLSELFQFLDSPNPSVRQIALQNLVGYTPKTSPQRGIFIPSSLAGTSSDGGALRPDKQQSSKQDEIKVKVLRDLTVLCRDQALIAHDALSALINLSDSLVVARHLVYHEFLVWLVSYTANTTSPLSPLSSMLLSNITSHPSLLPPIADLTIPIIPLPQSKHYPPYFLPATASASSTIHPDFRDPAFGRPNLEVGQEDEREIEGVRALVQAFEDGAGQGVKEGNGRRKGECHFLASVLTNISMLPATRSLLLTPQPSFPRPSSAISETNEPLLAKIVVHTEHPDAIRRGGALGCIKNCAMDRGSIGWLLATETERVRLPTDPTRTVKGVDVLPWVLGPLMGSEEYEMEEMESLPSILQFLPPTKEREKDPVLRLMCVEILLLLSTTFPGRQALRNRGAYFVVRELHKVEADQQIKTAIERLVSLVHGEEGHDTRNEGVRELVRARRGALGDVEVMGESDVIE
ncbi:MAG: hypothetical protein TREMPRED_005515, partial [Tremellales sp. Tagirdzhanova-0007]